MLNMGFTESINAILADVPQERNTLLFSATMSKEISRISKNYLRDAKEITIGRKNEGTANVKHVVYVVHAKDKYETLKRIVDSCPQIYCIIFCRTKIETQEIADKLMHEGYNADSLHGDLSQAQRDLVMQKFRIRNLQILVATDVAARGLDVDDLTHVINYGLPDDTESYTHRSGRTGRAGKTGTSVAIINMKEKSKVRNIEKAIGKEFVPGEIPTAKEICKKQLFKVIDDLEKVKVNEDEINDFMTEIYRKLDWLSKEDLIKRVVSHEFNRFYEYYRDRDDIEIAVDNRKSRRDRDAKGSRKAEKGYSRMFINLGKMDGFNLRGLMGMLNESTQTRVDVGRVDLMKKFSFFEVDESRASEVLRAFDNLAWNDRPVVVEMADDVKEAQGEDEWMPLKEYKRSRASKAGRGGRKGAPGRGSGRSAGQRSGRGERSSSGRSGRSGRSSGKRR